MQRVKTQANVTGRIGCQAVKLLDIFHNFRVCVPSTSVTLCNAGGTWASRVQITGGSAHLVSAVQTDHQDSTSQTTITRN